MVALVMILLVVFKNQLGLKMPWKFSKIEPQRTITRIEAQADRPQRIGSPNGRTRLYDTAVCHTLARLRGSNKRILPARQL
jgi:hypothetical protein